jgi:hypothetical protein
MVTVVLPSLATCAALAVTAMDDTVAVVLVVVVVEVALPVRLLELPPQPASNAPAKMQATTDLSIAHNARRFSLARSARRRTTS